MTTRNLFTKRDVTRNTDVTECNIRQHDRLGLVHIHGDRYGYGALSEGESPDPFMATIV